MQDIGGAIHAYQQALDVRRPTSRTRSTALDRLYRRTEQWEQLIDVLEPSRRRCRPTTQEIIKLRLEIGSIWDLRLFDAGQAIDAYKKVLDIEPQNLDGAARPRAALREDRARPRSTSRSSRRSSTPRHRMPSASALYERMAAAWEERFGKLDRAAEASRRSSRSTSATTARTASSRACTRQAGKWEALVETLPQPHHGDDRCRDRASSSTSRWAQVYEQELSDVDRAIEAYNDVLSFDADEPRALDALGRLYEKISEWDRAIDVMAHLVQLTDDPRKQVELYWRMGRIQYEQLGDADGAEANLLRGLALDPGARADDGGADRAVLGSR